MSAVLNSDSPATLGVNLTVKLAAAERDRLKALAAAQNRSPHYLMRAAINRYLEEEEAELRFIQAAKTAREHYKATGLHVTHEELGAWIDALKRDSKAQLPACHA